MNKELKGLIALLVIGIVVCIINILFIAWENGDTYETFSNGKKGRKLTWIGRIVTGLKKIM